jgi:putative tryptophan/tyrosine transport system substrate-binding protein
MTYGPNVRDLYWSLARYVDRVLRGTAPLTSYMAASGNTAKELGLTVPPMLLARADEVIE